MSTRQKVLDYLITAMPNPVSGQYIANQLNFSRNTIWKTIEELRHLGYTIEQQHKKGYVLTQIPHHLELHQLNHSIHSFWQELSIEIHHSVTSTNDLGKIHATQNPQTPKLIVAKEQTKGRGRHGRGFYSQLEHGLYLSLVIQPNTKKINEIPLYTLLTASALSQVLSQHLNNEMIKIKWVNDLFYNGKKISGILCESIMDIESQQVNAIVIGIGINLAGNFLQTNEEVQEIAGTIFGETLPKTFDFNIFLHNFIQQFYYYHQQLTERSFLTYYQEHLLGMNQSVHFTQNNQQKRGIIRGINQDGHLLVENDAQEIETLIGTDIHFSSNQFLSIS